MDDATLANIAVAIATLLLVFVTVYYNSSNIKQIKKQLRIQQRQITALLSNQEPHILVKKSHFVGNELNMSLLNIGGGTAYQIVVASNFYRVKLRRSKEEQQIIQEFFLMDRDEDLKDLFDPTENQEFLFPSGLGWENDNFLVKTAKRLGLASKFLKVHPKASVALVKCQDDGEAILKPGEVTKIFRANPVFFVTDREERDFYGVNKIHQCFDFEKLRSFCQQNKTRYIAVRFSIHSKDAVQNTFFHQEIREFIVDLEEDATLQDAYVKERDLAIKMITFSSRDSDKMCMSLHFYTHSKQNRMIPAEIFDDEIA
ncbi:hypothetical protein [Methanoculleus chikugoensis]|uniref:Uncharacterized protein n=1 Tax=Methanoculleus chikugoensis TaxID=118126 RepID=A0ABN5XIV9_9EURY|nr:hypothetical protein [Methanoculleus chikugoensis]BBL68603.1 hypothetical protein MchiMG62_17840 [Methanoculleus chikugoensis]